MARKVFCLWTPKAVIKYRIFSIKRRFRGINSGSLCGSFTYGPEEFISVSGITFPSAPGFGSISVAYSSPVFVLWERNAGSFLRQRRVIEPNLVLGAFGIMGCRIAAQLSFPQGIGVEYLGWFHTRRGLCWVLNVLLALLIFSAWGSWKTQQFIRFGKKTHPEKWQSCNWIRCFFFYFFILIQLYKHLIKTYKKKQSIKSLRPMHAY